MKAKLLQAPPNPAKLIKDLWEKDKHGIELGTRLELYVDDFEFMMQLLKEDWCPLTEFPVFIWQFRLPRSMHAQMRVHRHLSSFSESHQLAEPENFYDDKDYFKIPQTDEDSAVRNNEDIAMESAQDAYRSLRALDVLPSLARGVLPMHINLDLSVAMNLRTMFKLIVTRRCHILQGTYWNPLLEMMEKELMAYDARYVELFNYQPCDINKRCLSDIEQELRQAGQDPHAVCPRWRALRISNGTSTCCGNGCQGCLKHAVENNLDVERSISR